MTNRDLVNGYVDWRTAARACAARHGSLAGWIEGRQTQQGGQD